MSSAPEPIPPFDRMDSLWILERERRRVEEQGLEASVTFYVSTKVPTGAGVITVGREVSLSIDEVLGILRARAAASAGS